VIHFKTLIRGPEPPQFPREDILPCRKIKMEIPGRMESL
jgi:hypothetical protein